MSSRTLTPPEQPAAALAGVPAAALAGVPGLRLIKVPDTAPPYDCETHGAACPATRDAAGSAQPRRSAGMRRAPLAGEAADVLDTAPPGAAGPGATLAGAAPAGAGGAGPAGAGPAGAGGEADPRPGQLAQVIVEILAGLRSPRQVIPLTTDRARRQIGVLAPFLASDQRPRIKRVVTSRPAAHVVELTVVASFGPRSRALALRFEHRAARPAAPGRAARPARWLCTDLEAG